MSREEECSSRSCVEVQGTDSLARGGSAPSDLLHYSNAPMTEVNSVAQMEHEPGSYRSDYEKPLGLWVSVKGADDWPSWCKAEDFRNTRRQHVTRLILHRDARVLRMASAYELDAFTDQYASEYAWGARPAQRNRFIQWDRVAADWQGVIIAPYVWARRLDLSWYYTWDCASGCIWDADAVERLEPVRGPLRRQRPVKEAA